MRRWGNFTTILVMWLTVLFLALLTGGFAMWFSVGSLSVLLVYLIYVQRLPLDRVDVRIESEQNEYYEGEIAKLKVSVQLPCIPFVWIGIKDRWHRMPFFTGFKRSLQYDYQTGILSRGKLQPEIVHLYVMDIFGWVTRKRSVVTRLSAIVYPRLKDKDVLRQLLKIQSLPLKKFINTPSVDMIPEIIRDYTYGDPLNRIHWKATAKNCSLKTGVPEQQHEPPPVIIFVDTNRDAGNSAEKVSAEKEANQNCHAWFEHCVRMAAFLIERMWKQNQYPGLLLSQQSKVVYIPPGRPNLKMNVLRELALCKWEKGLHWVQMLHALRMDVYRKSQIIGLFPQLPEVERFHSTGTSSMCRPQTIIVPKTEENTIQQHGKKQWEQQGSNVVFISTSNRNGGHAIA